MKRIACALLCVLMILCGCAKQKAAAPAPAFTPSPIHTMADVTRAVEGRNGYAIHTAVLYSSAADDNHWQITMQYLEQPLILNLDAAALDAEQGFDLSAYDVVYLDRSLLSSAKLDGVVSAVTAYAENGGAVFVPNEFYDTFPAEFLGAKEFVKASYPEALDETADAGDYAPIQQLIRDFHYLYCNFSDAELLQSQDYGYAMVPDTAQALASVNGNALYAMNDYGKGHVLFTSPLLPNEWAENSLTLAKPGENQTAFSDTTTSCNRLLLNDFAAYAAKQIYGFALDRVYGYYGSPSMSWELHYEAITAMENGSLYQFDKLARDAQQVPSLTLIRDTYTWFARSETMTYALNQGKKGETDFQLDRDESIYSSGTHVDCGGEWLKQRTLEEGGSYFVDDVNKNYRLYPVLTDHDGDGILDAYCGSSDGKIYYYKGLGMTGLDGRLRFAEPQLVTQTDGNLVMTEMFSSPAILDVDGDGVSDLLVGGADGKINWYRGSGTLQYEPMGLLIDGEFSGQALPAAGDVNGDGVPDLLVGSNRGILLLFFGEKNGAGVAYSHSNMRALSRQCRDAVEGDWYAPSLADYNGDGKQDLLVGTFDGYVALLTGGGSGDFSFDRFVTADDMNYKGNHNYKFGNYAVPVMADLNGDGVLDLLVGSIEYGMTYPIDSPYFPYREELQAQVDFAKEHHYYMGLHFLTGEYYSADREAYELQAQKKAMAAYGLPTEGIGANQHTWYTASADNPAQSMRSLWNAGLLWESGYAPAGGTVRGPHSNPENSVVLPFYLMDGGERTILMQNCSILPYRGTDWTDISGRYQMPMMLYYHCDLIYNSDEEAKSFIAQAGTFQQKFGYNFMMEHQLQYGTAAAINLAADVTPADGGFTIAPRAESTDFPLYSESAQNAMGVRIEFTSSLEDSVKTDARVWKTAENGLAVGLDGAVTVSAGEGSAACHLEQVNIPASSITEDENGAEIVFAGEGMMQVIVSGEAFTPDTSWTVAHREDGKTVFTKYGAADTLRLSYGKEG